MLQPPELQTYWVQTSNCTRRIGPSGHHEAEAQYVRIATQDGLASDFCNTIGHERTH